MKFLIRLRVANFCQSKLVLRNRIMNNAFQFKFTSHDGKYSYTILPISRQNEALNVLTRAFYPFENVCNSIKLAKNAKAVEELNELVKDAIKDGVSIVAVDNTTNDIVGVSINKIQKLPAAGEVSFFETFMNERCKEKESSFVMRFMMDCDSTVDLFQHFNTEKLMEIMFLAVLPEYGKQSIGYELVNIDLQLLAELHGSFKGPDVATALWTSNFSAKIGERLGFQVLSECFHDKVDYNGVKLSDIMDNQHKCTRVAGKKLDSKNKS